MGGAQAPLHYGQLPGHLPPLEAPPGGLDEAGAPSPPVVGVEAEGVLELLAVQALELVGDEFEVLRAQGEGLHLLERPHRAGRGGQVQAGVGHQGPGEELFPAEVSGPESDRVEEPAAAAVGGGALQLAPDHEEHLVHRVALADDERPLRAQGGDQALADGVQELRVHLGEEGHLREEEGHRDLLTGWL